MRTCKYSFGGYLLLRKPSRSSVLNPPPGRFHPGSAKWRWYGAVHVAPRFVRHLLSTRITWFRIATVARPVGIMPPAYVAGVTRAKETGTGVMTATPRPCGQSSHTGRLTTNRPDRLSRATTQTLRNRSLQMMTIPTLSNLGLDSTRRAAEGVAIQPCRNT